MFELCLLKDFCLILYYQIFVQLNIMIVRFWVGEFMFRMQVNKRALHSFFQSGLVWDLPHRLTNEIRRLARLQTGSPEQLIEQGLQTLVETLLRYRK
jgi:hypothetical protein